MESDEKISGEASLSDNLVYALLCPEISYTGLGQHDTLTNYLYKSTLEQNTHYVMVDFIDAAEKFIDKENVDSELNHLKIQRLFSIIADIPAEVRLEVKLAAWERLLESDWVHSYANPGDLDLTIDAVAHEDEALAVAIYNRMKRVYMYKVMQFSANVGFSEEVPFISRRAFDLGKAFKGYDAVKAKYPESLPIYCSISMLAMSLASQTLVDN